MFGTTGCPEQFEKCMKKCLNLHKSITKTLNAFGSALKVEKSFFQLLGSQSEVAPSSGLNQHLSFVQRD